MKTARLRIDILPKNSGVHTYNRHLLDKDVSYEVLSEQSKVIGFPFILIHPILKNICLVDSACMNFEGEL